MFRRAIFAAAFALAVAPIVYAQQPTTPPVPEDALSPRELIAWSNLQTPRPAQEQLPAIPNQPNPPSTDSAHPSQQGKASLAQQEASKSHIVAEPSAQELRARTR